MNAGKLFCLIMHIIYNIRIVNNRYVASPNMPKPGVYADAASVRDLVVAGNVVVSEAPEKKR